MHILAGTGYAHGYHPDLWNLTSSLEPILENNLMVGAVVDVRPTENNSTRLYKNGDISAVTRCS